MNSASLGDKALANSDFPSAIQHFTQALVELPRAPPYYIKRSTAFSRLKPADGGPNYSAALHDAEIAVTLARERGKRELILAAQMRRGVALYQLGRYGDAAFVFGTIQDKTAAGDDNEDKSEKVKNAMAGSAKNGYQQELPIWTLKVKSQLNKLAEGDEKAAVTVAEYPAGIQAPSEKDLRKQLEAFRSGKTGDAGVQAPEKQQSLTDAGASSSASKNPESKPVASGAPAAPPVEKVRHEWYQSNESVVVTLYVKGVPKDKTSIQLASDSVTIGFPLPSGAEYDFTLDPLFAPIDPSASKVSVMSTKIELSLRKQAPGQKWNALEAASTDVKLADRQAAVSSAPSSSAGPTYPSSSRQGPKDWDKLASTLTEKTKSGDKGKKKAKGDGAADASKDKEGNESDGAESADSDYEGGDPVDSFFKKLYAGADPDTRRAMIKSYVESQGTSLSTNWNEVGQGKVEARPPSSD